MPSSANFQTNFVFKYVFFSHGKTLGNGRSGLSIVNLSQSARRPDCHAAPWALEQCGWMEWEEQPKAT